MRIVITGTPCSGKTTLAKALAKERKIPLIDINAEAEAHSLYTGEVEDGARVVDAKKLEAHVKKLLSAHESFICEGHLACEFSLPADVCVVLRCNPVALLDRMQKRKYSKQKIADNLVSEMLDYCETLAKEHYSNVLVLSNSEPLSAEQFSKALKKNVSVDVDWFPYFENAKIKPYLEEERKNA